MSNTVACRHELTVSHGCTTAWLADRPGLDLLQPDEAVACGWAGAAADVVIWEAAAEAAEAQKLDNPPLRLQQLVQLF